MALADQLSTRLDAQALVGAFLGSLGGHASALQQVVVPDDGGRAGQAGVGLNLDTSGIAAAVSQVAGQMGVQLGGLNLQLPLLPGLTAALALTEQLGEGDLLQQVQALAARLGAELEGGRDGGLLAVLSRVAALVSGDPLSSNAASLLQSLLAAGGVVIPGGVKRLPEVLPALEQAVRAAAGLMALESLLAESQRLTGVMAAQIDPDTVQADLQALGTALGGDLVQRLAAVDVADTAALDLLAGQLAAGVERFEALRERVAAGIGLGEATLAYLDIARVQREMEAAAGLLRGIDLSPLARMIGDSLGGLPSLSALNLDSAAAQSLDSLVGRLEGEIDQHAARIAAWDAAGLAQPLTDGISALLQPLTTVGNLVTETTTTVRGAMEQVRNAVAQVPVNRITDAVQAVLAPVVQALQLITDLVDELADALQGAAQDAVQALGELETTLDQFKQDLKALLADAQAFIEGLNLDQVAGQVTGQVTTFCATLQQVDMKPYFDTAVSAIGTAADAVELAPFDLLPEDLKAEFDAAAAPIRSTDLAAIELDIESALGITPEGGFALRGDLEAAIVDLQQRFDALIDTLHQHDPAQHLAHIDQQLQQLAGQIAQIAPAVTLQPVQDAIDQAKQAVAGLDLAAALQPLQQIFDDALAQLDRLSPAALIAPLQERLDSVRLQVQNTLQLDRWDSALDELAAQANRLLNRVDPARLQPELTALLEEARSLIAALPATPATWVGSLVGALANGLVQRIDPSAWAEVARWLREGGAAAALSARSDSIAQAVGRARDAVAEVDPAALAAPALGQAAAVRSALQGLLARLGPSPSQNARFATLLQRLALEPLVSALNSNRQRFLARLDEAASQVETLRRTGVSEADVAAGELNKVFAPVLSLLQQVRQLLARIGIAAGGGLLDIVRAVFDVVPASRLAGLLSPLFAALRGRAQALLDAVVAPLHQAVANVRSLLAALDLAPLVGGLQSVHTQVRTEVLALSPAGLLAAPLAAVAGLKAELAAFDPLAPLLTVLNALRDTATRVLGKLSAQDLLEAPLAIYREVLDAFDALDLQALLAPVFDLIDTMARQVDEGLDDTVLAFQRLQAALPAGGGGSSASVSVG